MTNRKTNTVWKLRVPQTFRKKGESISDQNASQCTDTFRLTVWWRRAALIGNDRFGVSLRNRSSFFSFASFSSLRTENVKHAYIFYYAASFNKAKWVIRWICRFLMRSKTECMHFLWAVVASSGATASLFPGSKVKKFLKALFSTLWAAL